MIYFQKYAEDLEKLIHISRELQSPSISLYTYVQHANLLETNAKLALFRVSVLRMLFSLHKTMNSTLIFKRFDVENQKYVRNAFSFQKRMKLKSRSQTLISTAFNLVINSSPVTDTSLIPPSSYSDQRGITIETTEGDGNSPLLELTAEESWFTQEQVSQWRQEQSCYLPKT